MMKKIFTSVLLLAACAYANAQKVQVLDRCESLGEKPTQWYSNGSQTKLSEDHKEGTYAISAKTEKAERLRKIYGQPFNTGVTKDNGYIAFWLFVERPELLNGNGQLALSSNASADKDAYGYPFGGLKIGSTKLVAGWNHVIAPLSSFKDIHDQPNLTAINYFRILLYNEKDDLTAQEIKIDNIRFSTDKAQLEASAK
ncbi:hypothetical protein [Pedobacter sp. MC2016-24]|uniref:hypothetical protein n=1 Tax=Pedobacter sp. MC2016-24 TaxID=2780090 RepID=UPI00187E48F8|nr:hypothetical protein [Pedobacter sp. MC2016-24]MBE9601073.1 hypothetical protein [Pedobacter sp. MC2016-24]